MHQIHRRRNHNLSTIVDSFDIPTLINSRPEPTNNDQEKVEGLEKSREGEVRAAESYHAFAVNFSVFSKYFTFNSLGLGEANKFVTC
jgi:hypothetical protein